MNEYINTRMKENKIIVQLENMSTTEKKIWINNNYSHIQKYEKKKKQLVYKKMKRYFHSMSDFELIVIGYIISFWLKFDKFDHLEMQ